MRYLAPILAMLATLALLPPAGHAASNGGRAPVPRHAVLASWLPDGSVASAQLPRVQIWVDGDQDFLQSGDRVRVRFRTSEAAYAAVVHIDTEGRLELVYPSDPWDDGYVRGQRVYSLPSTQWNSSWVVSGTSGIGYFYVLASPEPLDLRFFQQRAGGAWGVYGARHVIRGDPFLVLNELAEMLVPDWDYVPYADDVYSYHVGRRFSYPAYACYDRTPYAGRDVWDAYYGSCDRLSGLLRLHPDYYDTRRYRGDRRAYLREWNAEGPRHGYKERADAPYRRSGWQSDEPRAVGIPRASTEAQGVRPSPQEPRRDRQGERARPVAPERQRPKLERRPADRERARPADSPPARHAEPKPERPKREGKPPSRAVAPTERRPGG